MCLSPTGELLLEEAPAIRKSSDETLGLLLVLAALIGTCLKVALVMLVQRVQVGVVLAPAFGVDHGLSPKG